MRQRVEEGEQTQPPPEMEEPVEPVILRSGVTSNVSVKEDQRQEPRRPDGVVHRVRAGLAAHRIPQQERPGHQRVDQQHAFGEAQIFHGCTSPLSSMGASEELPQVHAGIEAADLLGVSIEHQRLAPAAFANALLGRLAPAGMIHARIDVGVEAVLIRSGERSMSSGAASPPA